MPLFTRKSRRHKRTHDIERQFNAGHARAETEHVAIVMFATLMRGVSITAKRSANAVDLIRRDRRSHTAAADQNPDVGRTGLHGFSNRLGVVRIIVGNGSVVSAEIRDLVSGRPQFFHDPFVERIPTMICTYRNPHITIP